ncbi:MAG: bifunctional homocysteine S-methyltransferase/methylenetetrahydrofolate reductase [Vicinamibacterales bacterium]
MNVIRKPPFLEELERRVLVCDGAMGTMLYARGVFLNRSFDELNLTQPELVADVHHAYVRAGADVIETNTFGANRVKLSTFGLADRTTEINVRGAQLARRAARDAYVAGSIGPLGVRIEPWGKTGVDEAQACFAEQAAALLEGGVDLFVLETFRDLNEIGAAIRAVRSVCALPIVAQVTTEDNGNTLDGASPDLFVPELERQGADVVGLNCSVGPAAMLETLERISRVARVRLSAQPNAGRPREVEGRNLYLCSPEYMASYAKRFVNAGVRLVGGCCGTTPEHIKQIRIAVRAAKPATVARPTGAAAPAPVVPQPVVPRAQRSRMAHALARGAFVVSIELVPPRGHRTEELLAAVRQLRIRGVDLVNIPDGPRASGRMSALATALLVQQAGLETILHYTCRDRNLLGMQSDLLGAQSMGIRNLLIVTGDPPVVGDYPDATAVFDVDSIGLTNVVSRLNRGIDIGSQAIGAPTAFHIGVAANPGAINLDDEVRRFRYKVEAGAEFAITQPVFEADALARFLDRVAEVRIPVLAAILPLGSLRHAEFMANEVPGVHVPEAVLERMRVADAAGRAAEEGIAIAREVVAGIRPLVQGLQVTTAAGAVDSALDVLETIGT